jgi:hypothetical protein
VCALAQLVEQPRVLDCDDRLFGEGADQLDLPLSERLDPLAGEKQDADGIALPQQWDTERGVDFSDRDHLRQSVFWIRRDISSMDHVAFQHCPASDAGAAGLVDMVLRGRDQLGREGEVCRWPVDLTVTR